MAAACCVLLWLGDGSWFGLADGDAPSEAGDAAALRGRAAAGAPALASKGARPGGASQASLALDAEAIGQPSGPLTGRVFDAAGLPLPGARVALRPFPAAAERAGMGTGMGARALHAFLTAPDLATATTGEDGGYVLTGAPDGVHALVATKEGVGVALRSVRVRRGLPVGGPADLVLPTGTPLEGRVLDGRGRGEAGLSLALADGDVPELENLHGLARTDADGRWTGLRPPGHVPLLYAARRGAPWLLATSIHEDAGSPWPASTRATVRLVQASGEPLAGAQVELTARHVDLVLPRGVALIGRVVDETGRPVAGARVGTTAHRATLARTELQAPASGALFRDDAPDGDDFFQMPAQYFLWEVPAYDTSAITDAAGRFVLEGLPQGKEVVLTAASTRASDEAEARIRVGRGPRQRAPDLVLSRGRTVRLRVVRTDGTPAVGAHVQLLPPAYVREPDATSGVPAPPLDMLRVLPPRSMRVTARDGRAVFRAVPPEVRVVAVTAEGSAGAIQALAPGDAAGASETTVVSLRPSAPIEGRVLDHAGRPVPNAQLTLEPRVGAGEAAPWTARMHFQPDADGRFALDGVPSGAAYTLRVSSPHLIERAVPVVSGQRGLEVRLPPWDVPAYERMREAEQRLLEVMDRPRPEEPEAARRHDLRVHELRTIHERHQAHYVGHPRAPASASGQGSGCG